LHGGTEGRSAATWFDPGCRAVPGRWLPDCEPPVGMPSVSFSRVDAGSRRAQAQWNVAAGDALYNAGRFGDALRHYRRCVEISPGCGDHHYRLACAAWKAEAHDLVEPHLREAIRLVPGHARAIEGLGQWYLQCDRIEPALRYSREALSLEPGNADFAISRAYVLAAAGRQPEVWDLIEPLLADPRRADRAGILYLRIASKIGHELQSAQWVTCHLRRTGAVTIERPQLHFAAAGVFERLERFDEAFEQVRLAHQAAPRRHDPDRPAREVNCRIHYCSADRLRPFPHATHGSRRPVFVVGMPRSGTSLVEQILASHPQVFGAGELDNLARAVISLSDGARFHCDALDRLSLPAVNQLAGKYLSAIAAKNVLATYVTDKAPLNFIYLDVANLLFPDCHVIHCIRDARDTCLSCYFTDFASGYDFAGDLTHLGLFYRQYERLMAHWKCTLTIPILDVRYEDMVSDVEGQTRRLLEFLDLPWDERCVRFHENRRPVTTASRDQVRQPLYSSSVGRWWRYERHLGELLEVLQ